MSDIAQHTESTFWPQVPRRVLAKAMFMDILAFMSGALAVRLGYLIGMWLKYGVASDLSVGMPIRWLLFIAVASTVGFLVSASETRKAAASRGITNMSPHRWIVCEDSSVYLALTLSVLCELMYLLEADSFLQIAALFLAAAFGVIAIVYAVMWRRYQRTDWREQANVLEGE